YLPVLFLISRADVLPRSVYLITWLVLICFLSAPRFLYRAMKDRQFGTTRAERAKASGAVPVVLAGAGDEAELFLRSLAVEETPPYAVMAIMAEHSHRVGRQIRGVPVMGTLEQFEAVMARLDRQDQTPSKVILTKDSMDGGKVRRLLDQCDAHGMTLARVPKSLELRSGVADSLEIRPVAMEDLLGRPQNRLDQSPVIDLIRGKRVLVTGAGGSIGSELVRQIADLEPARLILVEQSEYALYSIDMEASHSYPSLSRVAHIADVRDVDRMDALFRSEAPEVVFHAAALKHVPLVEGNPIEGLRTNAIGTRNMADCCRAHGVRTMVLISTDKAVNPTNVMGASKRMAESYCQAFDLMEKRRKGGTHFVTVRFGNVLGSTGSVVPLFQKQLARGGPLTVTHPDITRYFMTIREAVELVLQAAALGTGTDSYRGGIFVLDMGEPVKIIDLARQMIRLAGLKPDEDVAIEITGLRPGEKLFEEVFHGKEATQPTPTDGVLSAVPRSLNAGTMTSEMNLLARACSQDDLETARAVMERVVP
ncbi:MAG: polysaccharide biosynthesis protein, partial [Rhodospirillaceae bacterium]